MIELRLTGPVGLSHATTDSSFTGAIGRTAISSAPKQNRVTPMGEIVAIAPRGAWAGNRGILHEGVDVIRFHQSAMWIICALRHKDLQLRQWAPGHFTVLYFHDEAVALAAGHRPCAVCRRRAYNEYREAWAASRGGSVPLAQDIDRQLHRERIFRGSHRRRLHMSSWSVVPGGAFVLVDGQPAVVLGDAVVPWTIHGYADARPRPDDGPVELITPPSTVEALRNGYRPQMDSTAFHR